MSVASPSSLSEWISLTDRERADAQAKWNTYRGEGEDIVKAVATDFRDRFGHIPGLEVGDPGIYHGGTWVIAVRHPFVFDRRLLPIYHLGIHIRASSGPDLPPEFQDDSRKHSYIWAPPHYEQFVDRCAEEIRKQLRRPDMSRNEMLSALVGVPFEDFVANCRNSVRKGIIAPFDEGT